LHFVARRGFLSSKKQVAGDLVDDPDTQTYLSTLDSKQTKDEEGQFKVDRPFFACALLGVVKFCALISYFDVFDF
jgi:hypothetical protein